MNVIGNASEIEKQVAEEVIVSEVQLQEAHVEEVKTEEPEFVEVFEDLVGFRQHFKSVKHKIE